MIKDKTGELGQMLSICAKDIEPSSWLNVFLYVLNGSRVICVYTNEATDEGIVIYEKVAPYQSASTSLFLTARCVSIFPSRISRFKGKTENYHATILAFWKQAKAHGPIREIGPDVQGFLHKTVLLCFGK
ncbi:MAG: hypothetical protein JSW35_01715 [Deltaproteobacteria bacterium]|nr:MAG: hypothetical protein JSW35_01715 [Deltaproteobacteria bacterium]